MKLCPATLRGEVTPPRSKSLLHRELICQALCGAYPQVPDAAGDVRITQDALASLRDGAMTVDCGESGSTLRFLLPVAAALGRVGVTFTGTPRLLERPVPAGLPVERTEKGWRIRSALRSGKYVIDASLTSQVTSGLLMALPLLTEDSIVRMENPVSAGYVGMTASVLGRYGICMEKIPGGYRVSGGQRYRLAPLQAEADWSAAAWYAMVNRLGSEVDIKNVDMLSVQPDRAIMRYLEHLPDTVDISGTPDIFPVLALYAALCPGKATCFSRGELLRHKESDRLHNVAAILAALGVKVAQAQDSLMVYGQKRLCGGAVIDPCGDHRMAFLAAFAALYCDRAIALKDPYCVKKSYPRFWEDYAALGGRMEE